MSLKKRIRALETAAGDRGWCETCGYAPGAEVKIEVLDADEPDEGPDFCPECGRQLVLRLTFDRELPLVRPARGAGR